MKKRNLTIIAVALVVMVLAPMVASAQSDTESATLTVSGIIPSIVRIGFGTVGSDGTLPINTEGSDDLTTVSSATTTDVVYAANAAFTISVSSPGGTVLNHTGPDETATDTFKTTVPYSLSWGGTDVTVPENGDPVQVASGGPGITSGTSIGVAVDPANLSVLSLDGSSTTTDIEEAGTYDDVLTFTISAAN